MPTTAQRSPCNEVPAVDRFAVVCLGRLIGTADGCEEVEHNVDLYIDFQPSPGVDLAEGHLTMDYDEGLFKYHNKTGDIIDTRDIIAIVERLPRA